MSGMWLLLLSRVRLRRPRWFFPIVLVFAISVTAAGLIYALVVFKAIEERSRAPYVHTNPAH
jgi:hypothetical protein